MNRTDGYDILASVYDGLNQTVNYPEIVSCYESVIKKEGPKVLDSILDLGCGTGTVTIEMAKRGYDMIGIDSNEEMLSVAREKALKEGINSILWLNQDMTSFDLYGTVSAVVSTLDCVNHLLKKEEVEECFRLAHLFLEPNGLLIFDVNTPKKFQEVYAGKDYILENQGVLCAWHNEWHPRAETCSFCLSVFEETEDGLYQRTDAIQKERCYSKSFLTKTLENVGFSVLGIFDGWSDSRETDQSLRWQFVARCIKE